LALAWRLAGHLLGIDEWFSVDTISFAQLQPSSSMANK
jgi:hypothetical protein